MIQLVELLFRDIPAYDSMDVLARTREILESDVDCLHPQGKDVFIIVHKDHPIEYKEGSLPAQTAIIIPDKPRDIEAYRPDIQQSWRCQDAEELLRPCKDTRSITELMARLLPPRDRIAVFHGVLRAMIEVTHPDALVFKQSQQVLKPEDYLDSCDKDPILRPGSLNVRFFNISNSPGDMIMDTRGLTEIGLHDLQCHYRDLDPTAVSQVLYNTAAYIFDKGPVIESGQTVEGIEPGSKWRCQFEESMLEPKREVLDLNPGQRYGAGKR